MSTHDSDDDRRLLYSNFIQPRKDGWWGMTSMATYSLMGTAVVLMLLTVLPLPMSFKLFVGAATVLALVPLLFSFRGRSGWEILLGGRGRSSQRRRSEHLGRFGPATKVSDHTPAPAHMSDSEVTEHSSNGRRFAMIRVRPENFYTIVFRVWPQGREWVDQRRFDSWVANYGHVLAQIGQSPDVVGITTVIETLPESGQRVAREFTQQVRNTEAHPAALQVMWEAVFEVPSTEVRPEARISVTFRADSGIRRRDTVEQAAEISRRLPRMVDLIEQAGLPCRPMTAREVIAIARRAMSPSDEMALEKALLTGEPLGLRWQDVGAAATSDEYAFFSHDSGRSVTWMLEEPSKAPVDSRVLDELLAPRVEVPRKRVAFIYRPHTPAEATRIVDNDLWDAERALINPRGRLSEHTRVRARAANVSRQEQALGAGVTRFTILTTVTVPAEGDLAKAESLMNDLHVAARLKMRIATEQQSVAFLSALGLGFVLPAHTTISDRLSA